MKKYFRTSGLITFIVVVAIVSVAFVFFAETIIKSTAEDLLTEANGAKVDIGEVELSWLPLRLRFDSIEVADREQPMSNIVSFHQVAFSLSFPDLLLSKLIIDEMSATGIELGTARKTSGAISRQDGESSDKKSSDDAEKSGISESLTLPSMDLPDVNTLLATETLKSEKVFDDLEADIRDTKLNWKSIQDDLGNSEKWDGYDKQYDAIQAGLKGTSQQKLEALKDAKQLIASLKTDTASFKEARERFGSDLNRIESKIDTAKQSPKKDYEQLKQKIKLDTSSPENISQLIFGPQIGEYVSLARTWYVKVEPYLKDDESEKEKKQKKVRLTGTDVAFTEYEPKPSVFIKTAKVSVRTPRGTYDGSINDISSDQSINKKPMTLKLSAVGVSGRQSENVDAVVNMIDKASRYSTVEYLLKQQTLENYAVSKSKQLPLSIEKGAFDFRLDARLDGDGLKGQGMFVFDKVRFASEGKSASFNSLSSILADSFSNISKFDLKVSFAGSLRKLKLGIKSDIDDQLGIQVKQKIAKMKRQYEDELRAALNKKLQEPLSKLEAKRAELLDSKKALTEKENALKERIAYLQRSINEEADRKKEELNQKTKEKTDKLKDKLLNKLKGL